MIHLESLKSSLPPFGLLRHLASSPGLNQGSPKTNQHLHFQEEDDVLVEFDCIEKRGNILGQRSEWTHAITLVANFCLQFWVFCVNPFDHYVHQVQTEPLRE